MPGLEAALIESPRTTARRFYYDHVVQDPALLRLIIETYGDTQILVGSDYPFYPAKLVHPHNDFAAADLSDDAVALITNDNPRRFLGLA